MATTRSRPSGSGCRRRPRRRRPAAHRLLLLHQPAALADRQRQRPDRNGPAPEHDPAGTDRRRCARRARTCPPTGPSWPPPSGRCRAPAALPDFLRTLQSLGSSTLDRRHLADGRGARRESRRRRSRRPAPPSSAAPAPAAPSPATPAVAPDAPAGPGVYSLPITAQVTGSTAALEPVPRAAAGGAAARGADHPDHRGHRRRPGAAAAGRRRRGHHAAAEHAGLRRPVQRGRERRRSGRGSTDDHASRGRRGAPRCWTRGRPGRSVARPDARRSTSTDCRGDRDDARRAAIAADEPERPAGGRTRGAGGQHDRRGEPARPRRAAAPVADRLLRDAAADRGGGQLDPARRDAPRPGPARVDHRRSSGEISTVAPRALGGAWKTSATPSSPWSSPAATRRTEGPGRRQRCRRATAVGRGREGDAAPTI